MKKLLAVLVLAGVMTSCKSKKSDEKKPDATTTTTTTDPNATTTTTTTTTTSSDVPKFSDAEVQKYVDDYTAFVATITDAYKSKNAAKIAELSSKMSDWSTRSASVGQKLAANPQEAQAFTQYVTKLSQQMTAAMTGK
jgi:hypothetical protein